MADVLREGCVFVSECWTCFAATTGSTSSAGRKITSSTSGARSTISTASRPPDETEMSSGRASKVTDWSLILLVCFHASSPSTLLAFRVPCSRIKL